MTAYDSSSFVFVTIDKHDIAAFLLIDIICSTTIYVACKHYLHNELVSIASSALFPMVCKKVSRRQLSFLPVLLMTAKCVPSAAESLRSD